MIQIRQMLVNSSKYDVKCPYSMTPTRIVVHNTSNDASANNEVSYMINNNNEVSFHIAVDDVEAVQGIPFDRNTWNAGDGGSGKGNREGISIEICYSKSGGDKFIKAEQNAANLIAQLLKERGWGIDKVTKHQDYSGKYCPHRTLDMGWQRFLNMVQAAMNGESVVTQPTPAPSKSINDIALEVLAGKWGNGSDRTNRLSAAGYDVNAVQKRVNELLGVSSGGSSSSSVSLKVGAKVTLSSSAQTYATGEKIPNSLKGKTYTIQQVGSGKVLLKELYSWVKNSDIVGASSSNSTSKPTGTYKVTASDLIVRDAPAGNPVGHNGLTADGKNHDKDKDGALDYGTQVTVKAWHGVWAEIPSGFVHGDYLVKV